MQSSFRMMYRIAGIAALIWSAESAAIAATYRVGKTADTCPNLTYTSITDGVNGAAPGDVLEICPGLYQEQILITKPLTLTGVAANSQNRPTLKPALVAMGGLPFQAVITVYNTREVAIQNLTIDASNNTLSGCSVGLSGIHFYNASGIVSRTTVIGAQLANPLSCTTLFPGNGAGIQIDTDGVSTGTYRVVVSHNSIHDFSRNGVLAIGKGVTAEVDSNSISGIGPAGGYFQFGVFIAPGSAGLVTKNTISQANCGALARTDCINVRSEGVVLRSAADGTIIDGNFISNAQAGVFVNGANNAYVTNNVIWNIDALSGIHVQGLTNGVIEGNTVSKVGPITADTANANEGCGINEISGTGVSGNVLNNNVVTDAYCGIAYVGGDFVYGGDYPGTLYPLLNSDLYVAAYPPVKMP